MRFRTRNRRWFRVRRFRLLDCVGLASRGGRRSGAMHRGVHLLPEFSTDFRVQNVACAGYPRPLETRRRLWLLLSHRRRSSHADVFQHAKGVVHQHRH
jgi:hypothetical protein